jgi:hypothetical protein
MILRRLLPFLLLVLLGGGSGASHSAPSAEPVTPAPTEGEVFEWAWRPPVGTRGRFKIWRRMSGARNLLHRRGGPPLREERVDVRTVEVDFETISRDDRDAAVSRLVFRRISTTTSLKRGGKSVPDPREAGLTRAEQAVIGVAIDIKHGPDGTAWNVQGVQGPSHLQERLRAAASRAPAAYRALVLRVMKSRYSDASLQREWSTIVARPPQPVRVGELWRSGWLSLTPNALFEVAAGPTHRLAALTPARAIITHSLTFASRHGTNISARMQEVSTTSTDVGQTVVERATGLPVVHTSSYRSQSTSGGRAFSWTREESRRIFTTLPPL